MVAQRENSPVTIAPAIHGYLGLIPSDYPRASGGIRAAFTKAGNSHARRVLIEATWAYRYPAKVSRHLHLLT